MVSYKALNTDAKKAQCISMVCIQTIIFCIHYDMNEK